LWLEKAAFTPTRLLFRRKIDKLFNRLAITSVQWQGQTSQEALMISTLIRLWKNEGGATAIEYGLIAALIAVAAVATMTTVGTNLKAVFGTVASSL
jgi:pilus assembly protein Flp/PilA